MSQCIEKTSKWRLCLSVYLLASCSVVLADGDDIVSLSTTVGQAKVHYLAAGPVDGLPVLLLHGGRFQAKTWQGTGTLRVLADKGFRVVAVDLPGFGESKRSDIGPDKWLALLIATLKLDKPVLVSPSMSGRYAWPLVTGQPNLIRGFVAVAPVGIKRVEDKLSLVTVPVLAIWGANDHVVPLAHADLLVKKIPGTRKVIVPNAGHALYMDDAKTFHKELIRFLEKLKLASTHLDKSDG